MTNEPFACTLDEEGARARLAQAHGLAARLRRRELSDNRLVLTFASERDTGLLVDEFIRDEQRCCSFFEFAVALDDDEVTLELAAPEGAEHMLEAAMASFDPMLGDEERLALHRAHTDLSVGAAGHETGVAADQMTSSPSSEDRAASEVRSSKRSPRADTGQSGDAASRGGRSRLRS